MSRTTEALRINPISMGEIGVEFQTLPVLAVYSNEPGVDGSVFLKLSGSFAAKLKQHRDEFRGSYKAGDHFRVADSHKVYALTAVLTLGVGS